jgi:hypothetical protein
MTRRLLAALLGLAVIGTGPSPCVAAALASGPAAAADAHAAHHAAGAGASCHEPEATVSARCECGCTREVPSGAASSFAPAWAVVEGRAEAPEPAALDAAAEPAARLAGAPFAPIDHVPIAS